MRARAQYRRQQQGMALLVMVTILALGTAFILLTQMSGQAQRLASAATTQNVLTQAKDALIGRAALDSSAPGSLPCPDLHTPGDAFEGTPGDGDILIEPTCTTAARRIGRLPWKTLGLPDLRDASGERLWYALSGNFRDASNVVVNSDTPGTLVITGTAPASGIVAIVFAPGAARSGQNRDPSNSANLISVANYLDGANGDVANDDTFTTALSSDTFNDTLLAITHAGLFTVVENIVAKKIETDVKPFITAYAAALPIGAQYYPYAAPFTSPSTLINDYKGTSTTTGGLLPITLDPNFLKWKTPLATDVQVVVTGTASGTGSISSQNCSATTATLFTCSVTFKRNSGQYSAYFSVTARFQNVGMAFVEYNQLIFSSTCSGAFCQTAPKFNVKNIRSDGDMDVLFGGTAATNGQSAGTNSNAGVTITLNISWSPSTSQYTVRPTAADWFFNNQWYRLTYYSISTGDAPGSTTPCVPGGSPPCITVNNLTGTTNNKRAVLVLAGRAGKKSDGTDQTRPSSVLSDYFEGENLTPADRIFESNTRSNTFNDKVVVLAP